VLKRERTATNPFELEKLRAINSMGNIYLAHSLVFQGMKSKGMFLNGKAKCERARVSHVRWLKAVGRYRLSAHAIFPAADDVDVDDAKVPKEGRSEQQAATDGPARNDVCSPAWWPARTPPRPRRRRAYSSPSSA